MLLYKETENGYLVSFGTGLGQIEIDESEYGFLHHLMRQRSVPPEGKDYRLRADTLEWEEYDLPHPPPRDDGTEISDTEALAILTGGVPV